ncbi:tetratricopeptide repeat protein [Chryseobacterium sp. LC2016-29]|uniref:tetratricopeptide repeat protein n=1 Tax=Chryseobacterium sp. LC2016-29 TaxID=2897331 RepID=UPI001E2850B7|nr:tetratricopeptide repeat protein [Chryseobacterium sp. LC2016-29]MCD0476977.1 tetratricopeptide repeat protein [Chryseobacterium sp. LC2016-29]
MGYFHSFKYLFCFILLSNCFYAQSQSDVDFLVKQINTINLSGQSDQVLEATQKLIKLSHFSKNDKGLSYGNYFLASYHHDHANFKQSIDYAKKAQQYSSYLECDQTHAANISSLLAGNYLLLELYTLSFKNYRKALEILKNKANKTTSDALIECSIYSHMSYIYDNINKPDSTLYYLQKEAKILKKIDLKYAYIQKGCSSLGFGNYYLNKNNTDSAQYYYNKSLNHFKNKIHPCKIESLISLGNLYTFQKNYPKAQAFYDLALKSFNQHHFPDILSELYKKIAELKVSQGAITEAKHYQDLYLNIQKKLDDKMKKERDFALNEVMKEEKIKHTLEAKKTQRTTLIIISLLVFITLFIIYLLEKSKSKNLKSIEITQKLLKEKEITEQETHKLKQQINEAFDEIIQLAKDNNPSFYTRFQEVYPKFQSKMLQLNESLKPSELTFAAYIYLGFTTKEVADYTFKAIKTIENNRYNFRKKINLSPEKDLQVWLRNYIDNE